MWQYQIWYEDVQEKRQGIAQLAWGQTEWHKFPPYHPEKRRVGEESVKEEESVGEKWVEEEEEVAAMVTCTAFDTGWWNICIDLTFLVTFRNGISTVYIHIEEENWE